MPQASLPILSTRTVRWLPLHRQVIGAFQGPYHDLHYNVAQDPAEADSFYLFSPDTIVKISANKPIDVIENLYIRRKYQAALDLIHSTYSKPMLEKVQNAHFSDLVLTKQVEKAK